MRYGIIHETSASYVPVKNKLTLTHLSPKDVIGDVTKWTASYVLAFNGDSLVLANNLRRGIEISGGHIEPGETPEQAAVREGREETGAVIGKVTPLVRATIETETDYIEGYKYPLPVAHMEFYYGRVSKMTSDIMENEVASPIEVPMSYVEPPIEENYENGEVIFETDNMTIEDAELFLNKMKDETFSKIVKVAALHHFVEKRRHYTSRYQKYMATIDNKTSEEILDIINEYLPKDNQNEIIGYNKAGNYYIVGFIDEEEGRNFLRDMSLRNWFENNSETHEMKT